MQSVTKHLESDMHIQYTLLCNKGKLNHKFGFCEFGQMKT